MLVQYCRADDGEWHTAKSLYQVIEMIERENTKQLKAGAKVIEADFSRENYHLEVFDNGVVIEYYFYVEH